LIIKGHKSSGLTQHRQVETAIALRGSAQFSGSGGTDPADAEAAGQGLGRVKMTYYGFMSPLNGAVQNALNVLEAKARFARSKFRATIARSLLLAAKHP
jgi:hypothetical protein